VRGGVVGGVRVSHPVSDGSGGSELHDVEGAGEGLWIHTPDQGVQDCCGGGGAQGRGRCARGGVNSGPTGDAAKKACSGLDGTDGLDGPSHMLMVSV
jgi:hypothetical protein